MAPENPPTQRNLEGGIIFQNSILSLKALSAISASIALSSHVITHEKYKIHHKHNWCQEKYPTKLYDLLKDLLLEPFCQEIIERYLEHVYKELYDCIKEFENLFRSLHKDAGRFLMRNCKWQSNGIIDYKKTAISMISENTTNPKEKFKLYCEYCLEDEIRKTWLHVEVDSSMHRITFNSNPTVFYWICKLKNELDKIPFDKDDPFTTIENKMIQKKVHNWLALEYFWNPLDTDEQLKYAIEIIRRYPRYQTRILGKLDEAQQRGIFADIPHLLITNFTLQMPQKSHLAMKIWTRSRHQISNGNFIKLLENLLRYYDRSTILADIWDTAPDHLKTYVLENKTDEILKYYFRSPWTNYKCQFLMNFFADMPPNLRICKIFDNGSRLVRHVIPQFANHLLNSYLSYADMVEFKNNNITISIEKCYRYLIDENFSALDSCLKTYLPDTCVTINCHMHTTLNSWGPRSFFALHHLSIWEQLVNRVNFSSPRTHLEAHTLNDIKKRIILSFCEYCPRIWLKYRTIGRMNIYIEELLDTRELQEYKKNVLQGFRFYILHDPHYWTHFDENLFQNIALWCLDNDEKVKRFVDLLPIDEIFNKLWKYRTNDDLQLFLEIAERILRWYFVTPEAAKRYPYKLALSFKSTELNKIFDVICYEYYKFQYLNEALSWHRKISFLNPPRTSENHPSGSSICSQFSQNL